MTLETLEECTPLLRCHKQGLINIDAINEIVLLEAGLARIRTHSCRMLPLSRRYLKIITRKLLL